MEPLLLTKSVGAALLAGAAVISMVLSSGICLGLLVVTIAALELQALLVAWAMNK